MMNDDPVDYPPPIPQHRRRPIEPLSDPASRDRGRPARDHRVPAVRPRPVNDFGKPTPARRVTGPNWSAVWLAVAALALLVAAGLIGWVASGDDDSETTNPVGNGLAATGETTGDQADDEQPLVPAQLPAADEPGLVGLDLPLLDAYTGTGSTGSVELYVNTLTGEVCHQFDASAMPRRFRAYIREATFPQEGPIVVDLGDVADATPLCVTSTPIDLARALAEGDRFYVAAQSPERDMLLRGQLSESATVFDNRETVAPTEPGNDDQAASNDLFGRADEGAFLVVEAGRVTFEGAVPDEATAQQLRAAFVPLSGLGVTVVDNLSIEPGAPPPSGRVVVANALLFASGRSEIGGDAPVLQTLADIMTVNPGWTMTITGHTDNVGSFDVNDRLSLRRADSVRSRLAQLGLALERMRIQGAGAEFPIADNSTDAGRAQNRRIEIAIDSSG